MAPTWFKVSVSHVLLSFVFPHLVPKVYSEVFTFSSVADL